ncbi:thrombospondin [Penaeus vannamei]|uniref:Thrombospondin n=1 Tax=Penaeus vannamei TaxID=6689 RepID=A0A3R7STU9_PENVA|nr:uncharacterized protein LOC113807792 [Penaeus vannamei]ROT74835.1 thrombospondin [Penaeus vannamei]
MFPLAAALAASLVLVTSAQNGNSYFFECQAEGRFPHPKDCSSYVDCVLSPLGHFLQIKDSCNGGSYNEHLKTCVSDKECKNSFRRGRALISDHTYQHMCSEGNGFLCADCMTMISCVDGVAYSHPCSAGSTCAELEVFGGGVCYPERPEECACPEANTFRVDHYDSKKFFYCNDSWSTPEMFECPEETAFDETTTQCVNKENLPECERSGMFAIASNCSQYYTCIASKDGWIQKALSCDTPDFMYNEASGSCEDPCSWDEGAFSCQAEGRFPDPRDCQRFFECIAVGDGFRVFSRECPAGYHWDSISQGVGLCTKTTDGSSCKAFTPNKCVIPENMCTQGGATGESLVGDGTTPAEETPAPPALRRATRRGNRRV